MRSGTWSDPAVPRPYPKIELHVHLEATVGAARLRSIARRNETAVPPAAGTPVASSAAPIDFSQFITAWKTASMALRRERDFREVVVDYAGAAAAQGCVYIEAIFSASEPVRRGTSWQEVFEGYCGGGEEARARHGVEVRFTPEITRDFPPEIGEDLARWAVAYRERGVVGIGLGGSEALFPAELHTRAFAIAREGGLQAAPHAGEMAGPESVRAALDVLQAARLRHGVRAVEDAGLLAEIAARGIVCDVTPTSNVLLGVVSSLQEHPLPQLLAAGVMCSIGSDDPALLGTDLALECARATRLGHDPRTMYSHALLGAFCDESLKAHLRQQAEAYDWV
ncbi:MAG: adenosine deaminase [Thermoleophilia bacterium]